MTAAVHTLDDVAAAARAVLEPGVWDFIAGGAGDERTLRANEAAFDRYTLRPRVLSGVTEPDTAVDVLGSRWAAPLGIAPTAYHTLVHDEGEVATARAAGAAGVPFVVSTFAGRSLADIAAAATGPLWLQVYCFADRQRTEALVRGAAEHGFQALVLTADAPQLGSRLRDLRRGFRLPPGIRAANLPADEDVADPQAHARAAFDRGITWATVERLRRLGGLPVVVKGILTGSDAKAAVDAGAAAVVVSNHGGRQLDGAPAAVHAVDEVVSAVAGRCPVLVDGGVRRGTDVLMALGLGATAAFIGRPVLHGLAVGGADGVTAVLRTLIAETAAAMLLCGRAGIPDCDADLVGVAR